VLRWQDEVSHQLSTCLPVFAAKFDPLSAQEEQHSLRDVFALIESNKTGVGITEYSVGQTTLEQIFIAFARKGEVDRRARNLSLGLALDDPAPTGAGMRLALN